MNANNVYRCECSAFATIPGAAWDKLADADRGTLERACDVQEAYGDAGKRLEIKAVDYIAVAGRPEWGDEWRDTARAAVLKLEDILQAIELPEECENSIGIASVKIAGEEDPLFSKVETLDDIARMIDECEDYPGDLVAIVCDNEGFYNLEGDPAYFVRSSDEIITTDEGPDGRGVIVVPYSGGRPVRCSSDNGRSFCTPEELLAVHSWDVVADMFDYSACELTHSELAPCENIDFLRRYLEIAPCDLIIG